MLIILEKKTGKILTNFGTNSLYPDGGLPIKEKEDEIYIRLHDDSEFVKQIIAAYDYELVLNSENEVTGVIVHKTLAEYQAEQPIDTQLRSTEERIKILEAENADLWYENIILKSKVTQSEQEIADLWYQVIVGGAGNV